MYQSRIDIREARVEEGQHSRDRHVGVRELGDLRACEHVRIHQRMLLQESGRFRAHNDLYQLEHRRL